MALAIVLAIIIVASVAFHLLSPWKLTELASNWYSMDAMLHISFVITGLVFVAITLFMVVALVRYRHRAGHKAEFSPDNKKLEWWLLGLTTVGIVALLAPGLVVYDEFIRTPDDPVQIEVVGEQWRFSFRYPGEDGAFGTAGVRRVSADNPLGLDPDDPASRDDIVRHADTLRLPRGRPVQIFLRSKDVIHGFFVPQFRAKMDMVPGMVTHFWLTPTRSGDFQVLCTQHCGVGHFNMRSEIEVVEPEAFDQWLAEQETFGDALAKRGERAEDEDVRWGRELADSEGCMACHSVDGTERVGPTWQGLYGREVTLADDSTITADEAYIRRSISDPDAEMVKGYPSAMPTYDFDDDELDALVAFIRSLSETAEEAPDTEDEPAEEAREVTPRWGRELAESQGCVTCHSTDGSSRVGPTFQGLYGRTVELEDGSTVVADEDYIRRSIEDPSAQVVEGYPDAMPSHDLSDDEVNALILFLREELSAEGGE